MEPLYPQNILERRYPILREQREKAEREAVDEETRINDGITRMMEEFEAALYQNDLLSEGTIGVHLNTTA